jgi:hypothetical protein
LFTQFRPNYFFYFLWNKGQNFFPTLGCQIILVYSKNWTKTLKSVIMNDTGPHLGKSQNLKSSSELTYRMYKLCKFLLVCTYQNYYDENIWSCQRRKYKINKEKNAKNTIILFIICHRYFDTRNARNLTSFRTRMIHVLTSASIVVYVGDEIS